MKKQLICVFLTLFLSLAALSACQNTADSNVSLPSSSPDIAYVVYEAVFVDNEQIAALFNEVRGEPPYAKLTADYHVTTAFLPEEDARELYGREVTVLITGYKAGEITADDGTVTQNEGFKVELVSNDPEMVAYLAEHAANFHITGSFTDKAKYTGYLDFSDAEVLEYSVTGTFGAYLNGGTVTFSAGDVDKEY